MSRGQKGGRLHCCILFCSRTTGDPQWAEWICAPHWRLNDPKERKVYARMLKRADPSLPATLARSRIWLRLKRKTQERAVDAPPPRPRPRHGRAPGNSPRRPSV